MKILTIRFSFPFLLILAFASFILRYLYLDCSTIGDDEAFTLYYSNLPVTELWRFLFQGDNPPLWDTLVKYWTLSFSDSLFHARMLPVILSSLTTVFIYKIGEDYLQKRAGLIASLLYVSSNFSIYLSHDTRTYSLSIFLAASSFYFFIRYLLSSKFKYFVLVLLLDLFLCYSHYMTIYVVLIQIVFCFFYRQKLILDFKFWAMITLFIAICLPLLYVFLIRYLESGVHGTWHSPVRDGSELFYTIGRCFNSPVLTTISFIPLILGIYYVMRTRKTQGYVLLSWFLIPHVSLFLYSFYKGFYFDKYLYFSFPAIYLLIGYSLSQLTGKKAILIPLSFVLIQLIDLKLDTSKLYYHGVRPSLDKLADYIQLKEDQTPILIQNLLMEKDLLYYLNRDTFRKTSRDFSSPLVASSYFQSRSIYFEDVKEFADRKNDSFIYLSANGKQLSLNENIKDYYLKEEGSVGNMIWYKYKIKSQ